MGADGWLGIGWPKEFGGQGALGASSSSSSSTRCSAPASPSRFLTLCTVGPTLMKYGTDEQKRAVCCRAILRGELHFAIGYTEPEAGTDLASLQDARGARRRRLRRQRAEGVHQPRRVRRLHLAGGAHRPRRAQAQGHLAS